MTAATDREHQLRNLERQLDGGTLGVAATFLPTGETVFYNADTVFPTASVIKIAIVAELFTQEAEGRLSRETLVTITAEDFVAGSGVLALLTPGMSLPLGDLAMLTISISDNTASNLCLRAVGGPEAVNARMRETWGLTATTIHRPIKFHLTPNDPPHTATGTPRDMMTLCAALANGTIHNRSVSDTVLHLMANVRDTELLPRYLEVNPYANDLNAARPPFIVKRKTGAVTGVRNDAGLLQCGDETLAVCVYTKNCPDTRWTPANRGSETVARVGELLTGWFFRAVNLSP
jgi:beta-lactamase class A